MTVPSKRALILGVIGGAVLIGTVLAGVRVNTTRSIPLGFYLRVNEDVRRGAYVTFCPPPKPTFIEARERGYIGAGFCPGDFGFMMKRVAAVAGDAVAFSKDGVYVNGKALPLSAPLRADAGGRPLPTFTYDSTLGAGEVLLMSDVSGKGFDARYFGPVARQQITSVIRPIFTW